MYLNTVWWKRDNKIRTRKDFKFVHLRPLSQGERHTQRGGEREDGRRQEVGSEKLSLRRESSGTAFPCTPFSWPSACLHIDAALARGLHSVHSGDAGQCLLLQYQSVGRLYVESALEILSGFYKHADFLGGRVGNCSVLGKRLEGNYSILK